MNWSEPWNFGRLLQATVSDRDLDTCLPNECYQWTYAVSQVIRSKFLLTGYFVWENMKFSDNHRYFFLSDTGITWKFLYFKKKKVLLLKCDSEMLSFLIAPCFRVLSLTTGKLARFADGTCVAKVSTVWCRYNSVNFLTNPHNTLPIACPWGRGMGCLLWF